MMLSIITINLNNKNGLLNTINSVINQTWLDYEFIVIDGGSFDGSYELIQEYIENITYWVSEPDNGVFHAMNKGIIKATGNYLLMLNSGDYLLNNKVLSKVFERSTFEQDILYGDVLRESQGNVIDESIFPELLNLQFLSNGAISHQAAFIKRELHDIVGLYDEHLKFSSDWKFIILAICKFNASSRHLHFKIAMCNCDGITCSPSNSLKIIKERETVLKMYFSFFYDHYHKGIVFRGGGVLNSFSRYCKHYFITGKSKIKFVYEAFLSR